MNQVDAAWQWRPGSDERSPESFPHMLRSLGTLLSQLAVQVPQLHGAAREDDFLLLRRALAVYEALVRELNSARQTDPSAPVTPIAELPPANGTDTGAGVVPTGDSLLETTRRRDERGAFWALLMSELEDCDPESPKFGWLFSDVRRLLSACLVRDAAALAATPDLGGPRWRARAQAAADLMEGYGQRYFGNRFEEMTAAVRAELADAVPSPGEPR